MKGMHQQWDIPCSRKPRLSVSDFVYIYHVPRELSDIIGVGAGPAGLVWLGWGDHVPFQQFDEIH